MRRCGRCPTCSPTADGLLAEHARMLDAAYREVGGRLAVNA